MYNRSENTQVDSKYTVADILSSMANGEAITPSFADQPSFPVSGVSTGLTPILTPTTLANIEQTFVDLQTVPPVNSSALDHSRQSGGFVPPLVEPISNTMVKQEYNDYANTDDSSDSDWMPTAQSPGKARSYLRSNAGSSPYDVSSTTPHRSRKRLDDKNLAPEEATKRKMRRERNKLAAAKCRQRRVDLTNTLIQETEGLEEEKSTLENEIQALQQQKEQLEFLLDAHNPVCQAKKALDMAIKKESNNRNIQTSRPSSLPLPKAMTKHVNVTEATGVAISTPSSGIFAQLGLDTMMDGHTGLTPITGAAPSCGSEVHRSSSESSLNDPLASPTKLMAL